MSGRRAVRDVICWVVFPLTVATVLGGALVALEWGHAPSLVAGVGAFVSLAVIVTMERVLPFRRQWNKSQGDLPADLIYLPSYFGINALVQPVAAAGVVIVGSILAEAFGLGFWPSEWPLWGQFLLACVVVEFFDYWPHRWLHEIPCLWRFHAIHHNPGRVYWLNATRAHPMEIIFRGMINAIPMALAGAGPELLAMVSLTNSLLGLFQHANIDFKLGPLNWIFSVGEIHRWHHSVNVGEANNNYGSNFLFWDVVFGTRYHDPERAGPDGVGIENDTIPDSWWLQLLAPFRSR